MSIQFTSDKQTLLSLIQPAMYAASSKTTLAAIEGLLFTLQDGLLTVCGYDLEKGIKTSAQVYGSGDGGVILNAQKIASIIRTLPETDIRFDIDEKFITTISCGMSEFSIHGMDPESFPVIPDISGENAFTVKAVLLKEMIGATAHAVSQTDARPALTGELLDVDNASLTIVAADNYRLAMREEKTLLEGNTGNQKLIVPGKTLNDFCRLISDGDDPVSVEFTRKYIIFKYKEILMFSRLIDGEYLDYRKVIPNNGKTFVKVNRLSFIESVERASLLVDEKMRTPLRCNFSGNRLNISCSTQYGKVNESMTVEVVGDEIEIGFNNRYLLDALRAVKDEDIMLTMSSPLVAMTVTPVKNDTDSGYVFMVLPMRLKD